MKRNSCLLVLLFLLAGCSSDDSLDKAMDLREKMNENICSFESHITADYGNTQQSFSMNCQTDADGNVIFSVVEPESIAGISGVISESGGKLTFDGKAVAVPLLAEGQLSPVSGPWLLIKALRGGYLSSCCMEGDRYHLSIDDSYEAQSMRLELWFDGDGCVTYAEIFWKDRMLLSMNIEKFTYV